jgi:hypothetical protein
MVKKSMEKSMGNPELQRPPPQPIAGGCGLCLSYQATGSKTRRVTIPDKPGNKTFDNTGV